MAVIYDNIEHKFEEGLINMVDNDQVKRVDFCVRCFSLRGWERIIS